MEGAGIDGATDVSPVPARSFLRGLEMSMPKSKPIQACVAGGKPPCPICPVQDQCSHGIKMVNKNKRVLTREVKGVMGKALSNLAKAKSNGK